VPSLFDKSISLRGMKASLRDISVIREEVRGNERERERGRGAGERKVEKEQLRVSEFPKSAE